MLLRRRRQRSEIPTSSMADIAFLLIIFFMITAVFAVNKGLELKLPGDPPPDDGRPEPAVVIRVEPDGVSVDCRPVADLEEILRYLEPRLLRNADKPVVLVTDPEAPYSRMVEVYDLLVSTQTDESPWPFRVDNLQVPTRGDLEAYVRSFGFDPFEAACR